MGAKKKQSLLAGKINNKKESEIPKVKELIEKLGLESKIFTIDALHCQKDTTKKIIEINKEDNFPVKDKQKAGIYSIFRNFIINIFRKNGFHKITEIIEKCANRIPFMLTLF